MAIISFFGYYSPVFSGISAIRDDVSFDDWFDDTSSDLRGSVAGSEAALYPSFQDFVRKKCP
jgi:hypothetical protein